MHSAMRGVEDPHVLKVKGLGTIEHAQELRQTLLGALENYNDVILEFEELQEADLTCLQLLCSAHETSVAMNKRFSLHDNRPEALKKAVREAGYARTRSCHKDTQNSCLWVGGWQV